jgi:hypothetical protein
MDRATAVGSVKAMARACAPRWKHLQLAGLMACLGASGSCTNSLAEQGHSSSFLVIEQMLAASGADPTTFNNTLQSDVVTNVESTIGGSTTVQPTIFEDVGRVIARLGFKDPGTPSSPTTPTSANYITVDRYRVEYIRADGRNTPGVDVPYPFDGAATFSVLDIGSATFTLVRAQAKLEPPLLAMRGLGGSVAISTIAEVTFFGHDQTGAEVKSLARIGVSFADFGDPR